MTKSEFENLKVGDTITFMWKRAKIKWVESTFDFEAKRRVAWKVFTEEGESVSVEECGVIGLVK